MNKRIMKKYFYLATALIALASCANEEYIGDQNLKEANENAPIVFGFDVPMPTRAGGATAATALGNQFIVYAEKNETADGKAAVSGNLVFKNYIVNYTASSAYTSTSNTKDWEYVGFKLDDNSATIPTTSYSTNVNPNSGAAEQTIKYWDYGATNYVFTAFSAMNADITGGKIKVDKITAKEDGNKVYDKGYTVTVTSGADLSKLYFSDRNVIDQTGAGSDRTATNKYGGNATMTFRNSMSQVRVGMYETVPGYAISAISFKVTGNNDAKNSSNAYAFGAICPNVNASTFVGTINVTYYTDTDGGTENQPKLTVSATSGSNTDLILGTNINAISTSTPLATTAAAPTYDTSGGTYTNVLPQIGNNTSLKLKVNYTLYNSVTDETITVENATAEIPAKYVAWKANFKYTYLFKISDNTNGQTGTGTTPAGLYPITFDAVEVVADDGTAEYITTVSEPSITTFGVSGGKYVSGGSEYAAGSDIYATIVASSAVVTPTLGTNVNLYKNIVTSDANFPVTEASLAEAIAETGGSAGEKITYTLDNSIGTVVTKVPGEDGVEITQNAVKMAGLAAGTYAIEYIPSSGNKVYKVIKVVAP